jgi:hypothetical protein
MKKLLGKELRENAKWAALAMAGLVLAGFFALSKSRGVSAASDSGFSIVSPAFFAYDFFWVSGFWNSSGMRADPAGVEEGPMGSASAQALALDSGIPSESSGRSVALSRGVLGSFGGMCRLCFHAGQICLPVGSRNDPAGSG